MSGLRDGGAFILDESEDVLANWGEGDEVISTQGETLLIVGPQGVGKTTVAGRLILARAGIGDPEVLGLPVLQDPDRYVLYLALDRPRQIARSFRRMVHERDRLLLDSALRFWGGPLPFDVVKEPEALAEFALEHGAGMLVIDSLKDLALRLSDDDVGGAVNRAFQHVLAAGVELVVLHHQRKSQGDNRKPTKLDDVYGSTWLTAGAGSVVLLWGEPGAPIVEFTHLKQPAGPVGPLQVEHDHLAGRLHTLERLTIRDVVRQATDGGVTVRDAAQRLKAGDPDKAEIVAARRKLDVLVRQGAAVKVADSDPVLYRPVEHRRVPPVPDGVPGERDRNGRPPLPATTGNSEGTEGTHNPATPATGVPPLRGGAPRQERSPLEEDQLATPEEEARYERARQSLLEPVPGGGP